MTEDIKALIDKINQEGIEAAEGKASEIENQAKLKAEKVLESAKLEAERLIQEARDEISKMQEKEKTLLAQSGRDLLLVLRQEIITMLDKLVVKEVHGILSAENLFKILSDIIKNACRQEKSEIIISLSKDDLKALESGFLSRLKEETKKEIILRPSDTIRGGFSISFDAGKSQFDFSDRALAEYIGTFLKPKLKEILEV